MRPPQRDAPGRPFLSMGIYPLDTSFGTVLLYTLDTGVLVESRD